MKKQFSNLLNAARWICGQEADLVEQRVKLYQVLRYKELFGTYTLVLF